MATAAATGNIRCGGCHLPNRSETQGVPHEQTYRCVITSYSIHYTKLYEEVEYVLRLTVAEILARASEFTPDSIAAIRYWCRLTGRAEA